MMRPRRGLRVLTAGESFAAGVRVRVADDGFAYADDAGALEAYGDGAAGYCVTVGPPRAELTDTPSRVVRVGRDGAELGVEGGRRL